MLWFLAQSESDVDLGRGYGLDTGRAPAPNGYYINEMELPPSPDGAFNSMLPFIW